MAFKTIDPFEKKDNIFELVSKEWMLLSAEKDSKVNTMTISWGMAGVFWGKNIFIVGVRPERYTHEFIEAAETFSLSVFNKEFREKLLFCGTNSGRDVDKIRECGFNLSKYGDTPYFDQATTVFICKKLYKTAVDSRQFIDEDLFSRWYGDPLNPEEFKGNLHDLYFAEILNVLEKHS